jgi:hypothetical protein
MLKVGTSFEIGDWLAWNQTVARVVELVPNDGVVFYSMSNGGCWSSRSNSVVRVCVTFPKPRRKLKPSAALAWLNKQERAGLRWDGKWQAWCEGARGPATGETMCAAIIALRKAVGVKS